MLEPIADWRASIEGVASGIPYQQRLQEESLRFLAGEHAIQAIDRGWDAVSLFGAHKAAAPNMRPGAFGLLPHLAWGLFGYRIRSTDREGYALLTKTGSLRRKARAKPDSQAAIPCG